MNQQPSNAMAEKILQIICRSRRVMKEVGPCQHQHYADCVQPHLAKIRALVQTGEPITLVLPAFPAKSPNANKTYGALPDLGERMALRALEKMCVEIEACYRGGAEIIICSDGRVFNDLVRVRDEDVDAYAAAIRHILREDKLSHIVTFSLDDCYVGSPYQQMRASLVQEFATPLDAIMQQVKQEAADKALFNGIHRFIFEDYWAMAPLTASRNHMRALTKPIAYQVIQRSHAWSKLVGWHFPNAVRLSIHPQPCGSEKLGVMLLTSGDTWATPWHRVVLQNKEQHVLMRNKEAQALGAAPIFINKQFSHYEVRDEYEANHNAAVWAASHCSA